MNEFENMWVPITKHELQVRFGGITDAGIQELIDDGILARRYNEQLNCYEYQLRDQRLIDAIQDAVECGEGEAVFSFLSREIDMYERRN